MSDAPEIFQCPNCQRQFTPEGFIRPRMCVPIVQRCYQPDCAHEQQQLANRRIAIALEMRERMAQGRARRLRQREQRQMHRRQTTTQAAECHRGMPPEQDDMMHQSHAEQQAEFANSLEARTQNEAMLGELLKTFDLHDATRTARSRWITNKEWHERFGITRPNSRASQLNGADTLEPHPVIKMHRLYVDSRIQLGTSQVWERSLCYVEHSLALSRERKKSDSEQVDMPLVPICSTDAMAPNTKESICTRSQQGT